MTLKNQNFINKRKEYVEKITSYLPSLAVLAGSTYYWKWAAADLFTTIYRMNDPQFIDSASSALGVIGGVMTTMSYMAFEDDIKNEVRKKLGALKNKLV